jgi:hypothetical protein
MFFSRILLNNGGRRTAQFLGVIGEKPRWCSVDMAPPPLGKPPPPPQKKEFLCSFGFPPALASRTLGEITSRRLGRPPRRLLPFRVSLDVAPTGESRRLIGSRCSPRCGASRKSVGHARRGRRGGVLRHGDRGRGAACHAAHQAPYRLHIWRWVGTGALKGCKEDTGGNGASCATRVGGMAGQDEGRLKKGHGDRHRRNVHATAEIGNE